MHRVSSKGEDAFETMTTRPVTLPAVILAAGRGERLVPNEASSAKPLTRLLGLTLLERAILTAREAEITRFFVVLGYRREEIAPRVVEWGQSYGVDITVVENCSWQEGNGTSVLVCADLLDANFLLLMCDHLFDADSLACFLNSASEEAACHLLVDPRIDEVFDPEDATRVRTKEGRIRAIGKGLEPYNGIDTGIFRCTPAVFSALKQAQAAGDGSLTGGIRLLAAEGKVRAVVLPDPFWLDVDTHDALRHGRRLLLKRAIKTGEDGVVARWFNRPISLRLSAWLLEHKALPWATPNVLSFLSFFIVACGGVLFASGGYLAGLIAGILTQSGSILDGCDGETARLAFRTSRFGAWFDTLLDRYGDAAIAIGVTIGYWQERPSEWVWIGGILALLGFILASYTKKEYALHYRAPFRSGLMAKLIKRDFRLFGIFVGAVIGHPYLALLALGALSHVGIVWLFAKRYVGEHRASS